jgi:hypothetical protein
MLAQFLINYRSAIAAQDPGRRKLIYFFCGTQDGRNSGASILRGLVYQLLDVSKSMFRQIQDAFSKHGQGSFSDDRFETLWKVFDAMIRDEELDTVTCILDGLDECVEEMLVPFLTKLRDLWSPKSPASAMKHAAKLKLIVISRHYPESLEIFFKAFPRLRIGPEYDVEIQRDVSKYVDHRMEELACAEKKKPKLLQLRSHVRKKLIDGAEGSYLSVNFAINSLKDVMCPELEQAISGFPRGLDAVYTRMLQAVSAQQVDTVSALQMGNNGQSTSDIAPTWRGTAVATRVVNKQNNQDFQLNLN